MDPQQFGNFTQPFAPGYGSMTPGIPNRRPSPFEGMPFFSNTGMLGNVASMFLQGPMASMFGQMGMLAGGIGHDQNIYDRMRAQNFFMMQNQAMTAAAVRDQQAVQQTFRGIAALTGTPFGTEQRRAAQGYAQALTPFAPLAAQIAPEFLDMLGGARGSATVMAQRMIDAGRYRVDPITGRLGMSAEVIGGQATGLFDDLYGGKRIAPMRGLTAGQVGGLFQELQSRGMLATAAVGPGGISGDIRQAAGNLGIDTARMGGAELDKLTLDPNVRMGMRGIDTERIKKQLKGYSAAIAAVRDLFGDMGQPNAPMAELVKALEALTTGASAQLDPGKLATMVRMTTNLSKQTGMTIENAVMLQQHAAARAGQLGLEPVFGVQAAQGAMAFGGAYRGQGHAAVTAWGALNADQITQLDANLRTQAAGSNMANQLAAATRLSAMAGGFAKGSDAALFVAQAGAAARTGRTTWTDAAGNERSFMVSAPEMTQMLVAGGRGRIGSNDVYDVLSQTEANRESIFNNQFGDVARRAQREEVGGVLAQTLQGTIRSRLMQQSGVSEAAANKAAADVAGTVATQIMGLSTRQMAPGAREAEIGRLIGTQLQATGNIGVLAGMSPMERLAWLQGTGNSFAGAADRDLTSLGYQNLTNMHRINNDQVFRQALRDTRKADNDRQLQDALSGLGGTGSAGRQFFAAIQGAKPGADLAQVAAVALGGVRIADVEQSMLPIARQMAARIKTIEGMQGRDDRTPDQEQALQNELRTLTGEANKLREIQGQTGLYSGASISGVEVAAGVKAIDQLRRDRMGLAPLLGGYGTLATADEMAATRASYTGQVSEGRARAALQARGVALTTANIKAEAANASIHSAAEAQAVAVYDRQRYDATPSKADTDRVAADYNGRASPDEVNEVASARRQALRSGISRAEIQKRMGVDMTPQAELRAITSLMQGRAAGVRDVTDAERDAFLQTNKPTATDLQEFMDRNPDAVAGKTPGQVAEMYGVAGVRGRQIADRAAMVREFLTEGSEGGDAFRESVRNARQGTSDLIDILGQPDSFGRLGPRAGDLRRRLQKVQTRRIELATLYTDNSQERLEAGDYNQKRLNEKTVVGQKLSASVTAEMNRLSVEEDAIKREIAAQQGLPGGQYGLGDYETIRDRMLGGRPATDLTADARDAIARRAKEKGISFEAAAAELGITDTMAPGQRAAIVAEQERVGDQITARRILGPGAAGPLGAAAVAAVTAQVGLARRISPTQQARLSTLLDDSVTPAGMGRELGLDALAKELGVTKDVLKSIPALKAKLGDMSADVGTERSPEELLKGLVTAAGGKADALDLESQAAQDFLAVAGSAVGRTFLQRTTEAASSIGKAAGGTGQSSSQLLSAYKAARKTGDLTAFFAANNIKPDDQEQLRQDLEYVTGTSNEDYFRDKDPLKLFKAGKAVIAAGGEGEKGVTVSGKLDITLVESGKGYGNLVGAIGGGLTYPVVNP